MEQTNNNQKKTAAERYAYVNEGDAFAQVWQQAEQGDLKAQKRWPTESISMCKNARIRWPTARP